MVNFTFLKAWSTDLLMQGGGLRRSSPSAV